MKKATLLIFGLILFSGLLFSQQNELKVLFVGNSYTYGYNLAHIVSIISEGTSTKLITRKSTIGGASLREHWRGGRELETKKIIAEGNFDIVVLQDFSMSAIQSPDSTLKYVKLFTEYNSSFGALTYLFNTWAREKVPQFQAEIDEIYRQAARENGGVRVPVGAAWALAQDLRPMVDLYTSDGSHPNELGTMLSASVFVRVICEELPEVLPTLYRIEDASGETVRLMNHNPEDAEFCRRIANAVTEFK
ncbi:MAG: hypothetical protein DRJ29_11200 [Bacteroidetes bacterium]|nr:MAG: hypothetical protein DRJ29_11200 [Bacteroidota bacterium]